MQNGKRDGGRAFWQGTPLEQTEFGSQIVTSDLGELFAPLKERFELGRIELGTIRLGTAGIVRELQRSARGVWIADEGIPVNLYVLNIDCRG